MRRIGLVVNPIAGMGGRVGLKGTDGMVERARELGAEPRAPDRAEQSLRRLHQLAPDATVVTYGAPMGESEARAAGFEPEVVGEPADPEETTAADTRAAVRELVAAGVDLILFVGGDGTAVDVAETLEELDADEPEPDADEPEPDADVPEPDADVPEPDADVPEPETDVPMLGVPAGVKVFSSVFAVTPRDAAAVVASFERTERREVNDIDEEAYREEGVVRSEPRAVATVPVGDDGLQAGKQLAGGNVETLADGFAADAEPGITYVLGPGGTLQSIKRALGFEGSPLGVDVWRAGTGGDPRDGEVLAVDASESTILEHLGEDNVVVVSPVGGQGFVLGRGNQQISPAVLRRCELEVVASRAKLDDVGVLRVDTGDDAVDDSLRGWTKVRVGRFERRMMQVV